MQTHGPFLVLSLLPSLLFSAEDAEPNYDEHIKPILRQHCLKCHGEDKQKAGLNMQTYAAAMKGGSGGEALIAGRSSQSLMFQAITDPDDEARMPPDKPAIPAEQIAMIQKWIDTGLRESSKSKSMVAARDTSFQPAANAGAKPENPAMPENLPEIEVPKTVRPLPVLALDASPWAPLVAVSGQEHVRLIHTETEEEIGKLAFPEGIPHVIRFSRDGAVLMVAGGRPVESGKAVLFDVKSGKRLAEIGDEIDAVLAADLSPDQQLLALGGSGKIVKVYSTADGKLQYKIEKHTDWITAVGFSPDGTKLATADRAGGIHLWDAKGGGILLSLSEHKASVRALDWRSDSKFLASVSEDGKVIWWDVNDGWPAINKPNAHPPQRPAGSYGTIPNGVLAARFAANGNLSTTGRDRVVQVWNPKGESLKKFTIETGLPISAAMTHDGGAIVSGDSNGEVRFWRLSPKTPPVG
jgi:cytochrome c551/c552